MRLLSVICFLAAPAQVCTWRDVERTDDQLGNVGKEVLSDAQPGVLLTCDRTLTEASDCYHTGGKCDHRLGQAICQTDQEPRYECVCAPGYCATEVVQELPNGLSLGAKVCTPEGNMSTGDGSGGMDLVVYADCYAYKRKSLGTETTLDTKSILATIVPADQCLEELQYTGFSDKLDPKVGGAAKTEFGRQIRLPERIPRLDVKDLPNVGLDKPIHSGNMLLTQKLDETKSRDIRGVTLREPCEFRFRSHPRVVLLDDDLALQQEQARLSEKLIKVFNHAEEETLTGPLKNQLAEVLQKEQGFLKKLVLVEQGVVVSAASSARQHADMQRVEQELRNLHQDHEDQRAKKRGELDQEIKQKAEAALGKAASVAVGDVQQLVAHIRQHWDEVLQMYKKRHERLLAELKAKLQFAAAAPVTRATPAYCFGESADGDPSKLKHVEFCMCRVPSPIRTDSERWYKWVSLQAGDDRDFNSGKTVITGPHLMNAPAPLTYLSANNFVVKAHANRGSSDKMTIVLPQRDHSQTCFLQAFEATEEEFPSLFEQVWSESSLWSMSKQLSPAREDMMQEMLLQMLQVFEPLHLRDVGKPQTVQPGDEAVDGLIAHVIACSNFEVAQADGKARSDWHHKQELECPIKKDEVDAAVDAAKANAAPLAVEGLSQFDEESLAERQDTLETFVCAAALTHAFYRTSQGLESSPKGNVSKARRESDRLAASAAWQQGIARAFEAAARHLRRPDSRAAFVFAAAGSRFMTGLQLQDKTDTWQWADLEATCLKQLQRAYFLQKAPKSDKMKWAIDLHSSTTRKVRVVPKHDEQALALAIDGAEVLTLGLPPKADSKPSIKLDESGMKEIAPELSSAERDKLEKNVKGELQATGFQAEENPKDGTTNGPGSDLVDESTTLQDGGSATSSKEKPKSAGSIGDATNTRVSSSSQDFEEQFEGSVTHSTKVSASSQDSSGGFKEEDFGLDAGDKNKLEKSVQTSQKSDVIDSAPLEGEQATNVNGAVSGKPDTISQKEGDSSQQIEKTNVDSANKEQPKKVNWKELEEEAMFGKKENGKAQKLDSEDTSSSFLELESIASPAQLNVLHELLAVLDERIFDCQVKQTGLFTTKRQEIIQDAEDGQQPKAQEDQQPKVQVLAVSNADMTLYPSVAAGERWDVYGEPREAASPRTWFNTVSNGIHEHGWQVEPSLQVFDRCVWCEFDQTKFDGPELTHDAGKCDSDGKRMSYVYRDADGLLPIPRFLKWSAPLRETSDGFKGERLFTDAAGHLLQLEDPRGLYGQESDTQSGMQKLKDYLLQLEDRRGLYGQESDTQSGMQKLKDFPSTWDIDGDSLKDVGSSSKKVWSVATERIRAIYPLDDSRAAQKFTEAGGLGKQFTAKVAEQPKKKSHVDIEEEEIFKNKDEEANKDTQVGQEAALPFDYDYDLLENCFYIDSAPFHGANLRQLLCTSGRTEPESHLTTRSAIIEELLFATLSGGGKFAGSANPDWIPHQDSTAQQCISVSNAALDFSKAGSATCSRDDTTPGNLPCVEVPANPCDEGSRCECFHAGTFHESKEYFDKSREWLGLANYLMAWLLAEAAQANFWTTLALNTDEGAEQPENHVIVDFQQKPCERPGTSSDQIMHLMQTRFPMLRGWAALQNVYTVMTGSYRDAVFPMRASGQLAGSEMCSCVPMTYAAIDVPIQQIADVSHVLLASTKGTLEQGHFMIDGNRQVSEVRACMYQPRLHQPASDKESPPPATLAMANDFWFLPPPGKKLVYDASWFGRSADGSLGHLKILQRIFHGVSCSVTACSYPDDDEQVGFYVEKQTVSAGSEQPVLLGAFKNCHKASQDMRSYVERRKFYLDMAQGWLLDAADKMTSDTNDPKGGRLTDIGMLGSSDFEGVFPSFDHQAALVANAYSSALRVLFPAVFGYSDDPNKRPVLTNVRDHLSDSYSNGFFKDTLTAALMYNPASADVVSDLVLKILRPALERGIYKHELREMQSNVIQLVEDIIRQKSLPEANSHRMLVSNVLLKSETKDAVRRKVLSFFAEHCFILPCHVDTIGKDGLEKILGPDTSGQGPLARCKEAVTSPSLLNRSSADTLTRVSVSRAGYLLSGA